MAYYRTLPSGKTRVEVEKLGVRKTESFLTKTEAKAWAAATEAAIEAGAMKPGSGITAGMLFDDYLRDVGSKTDSAKWNKLRINNWQRDPIAALQVTDLITHDINGWIDRRLKTVTGSTVNRELTLLSSAFTYAVKTRKWLTTNPCSGANHPPMNQARDRALLKPKEIEAICTASGYHTDPGLKTLTARVCAAFLLALETGARSGELLRIKPDHYFPEKKIVWIAAQEKGGRKGAKSGKTSASRYVPLTVRAVEILNRLLATRDESQPYIIGVSDSTRDALWRKARNRAGVKDLHFHDTKHEAATRLAPFMDVIALSHALGTKDIALLRDTYYNNDAEMIATKLPAQLAVHAPHGALCDSSPTS